MKLEERVYLDFDDVLIRPTISEVESRNDVDLRVELHYLGTPWRPIPVMSANMDTVTDAHAAYILAKQNWIAVMHKFVEKEDIRALIDQLEKEGVDLRNLFISRGTSERDRYKLIERLEHDSRIKSVCIDVANGYRKSVFDYVNSLRDGPCKDKILMVGNFATPDAAMIYEKIGVDILKCGLGSGSACITRVQTGVGVPQVSMIDEIKSAVKIPVCSDGGCRRPGDIAKAFVAGADFVMIGGMLAGHNESPGETTYAEGRKLKRFSGMAARQSQWNGVPMYGAEEGKTVFIDARGSLVETLQTIEGGIRSTCTYVNAKTISELKNATLIRTHVQENRHFS